jgi:hypothetical protein
MKTFFISFMAIGQLVLASAQSSQKSIYPKAELFFCGLESGKEISNPCTNLSVDFPKNAASNESSKSEVVSWEYMIPNAELGGSGTGSEIELPANLFGSLGSGETIEISVVYSDSQGIQRKAAGHWTIIK